jgi:D-glycero-D-manno-heptose 1,7-bisphosphate phosphatase
LDKSGYLLFVVSNQPSYAKGKTTLENIKEIHDKFHTILTRTGVTFTEYYYCFHHPDGIIPKFSGKCHCRKPEPYFPLKAKKDYQLDMSASWFIGDRDSDIFCGQNAGVRTIMINEPHSIGERGQSTPDYWAQDIKEAEKIIHNNQ